MYNKRKFVFVFLILFIFSIGVFLFMFKESTDETPTPKNANYIKSDKWYEQNKLIMHAMGGIDGKTYLNVKESLEYYYKKNQKIFEIDLALASDGEAVAIHDWGQEITEEFQQYTFSPNNVPSSDEFVSRKIYYKYSAMKFEDVLQFMKAHEDVYFVTDIKELYDTHQVDTISNIVKTAKQIDESLLKRVIVQVYNEKNFGDVNSIYPFENYIFTTYTYPDADFSKLAIFCAKNNIDVVTMGKGNIDNNISIDPFVENGIKVYIHTENSLYKMKWYFEQRIDGIYTDFITNEDLKLINAK